MLRPFIACVCFVQTTYSRFVVSFSSRKWNSDLFFLWQLGSWWVGGGVLHSCYDVAPREVVTQVCQERFNLNDLSIILAFSFFLFAYFLSSVNLVSWWINCNVNNTNFILQNTYLFKHNIRNPKVKITTLSFTSDSKRCQFAWQSMSY